MIHPRQTICLYEEIRGGGSFLFSCLLSVPQATIHIDGPACPIPGREDEGNDARTASEGGEARVGPSRPQQSAVTRKGLVGRTRLDRKISREPNRKGKMYELS